MPMNVGPYLDQPVFRHLWAPPSLGEANEWGKNVTLLPSPGTLHWFLMVTELLLLTLLLLINECDHAAHGTLDRWPLWTFWSNFSNFSKSKLWRNSLPNSILCLCYVCPMRNFMFSNMIFFRKEGVWPIQTSSYSESLCSFILSSGRAVWGKTWSPDSFPIGVCLGSFQKAPDIHDQFKKRERDKNVIQIEIYSQKSGLPFTSTGFVVKELLMIPVKS